MLGRISLEIRILSKQIVYLIVVSVLLNQAHILTNEEFIGSKEVSKR
jgi:hypothetical protein